MKNTFLFRLIEQPEINSQLLFIEEMSEVLVRDEALKNGNHETKIERIYETSDWNLMLFDGYLNNRKVNILDDAWTTSVHLLNKLPNSIIYDEIILLFLDIAPQVVFIIKQFGVIDASQFSLIYIFQICGI